MAQLINVRLSRVDASPWGFRLQGGKDFGQPLLIQKVNGGSPAERAGLQVGDALVRVNGVDVQELRHKDAQDTIVRAGNSFELSVQRGGVSTWKPHVAPVGNVPAPGSVSSLPVTKTSLAAKPSTTPIPSGHNVSPRPFGTSSPQLNGGDVKAVVNKQYNSPIGVYSEETIAETLSAQTEVLATGALGVNFMKNEKSYDSQKSEVFKMVQEVDQEPREPEPAPLSNSKYFSTTSHAVGGRATSPRPLTPIARQMGGPPELPQDKPYMPPPSPLPGSPLCSECGKHIVGVFVRIKDKNLHVECFKCATCGTSLKNVGYYTINSKLYCDIHAKMVARQNPPAPNLDPITIPPGGRIPTGAISSPVFQPSLPSALSRAATNAMTSPPASLPTSFPPSLPTAGPQSPQPGTLAPLPFHTPSAPAPKPFGSVAAPAPPPPATIPFAPSSLSTNFGSTKQTENLNPVIWPPVKHQVSISEIKHQNEELKICESMAVKKRVSICSEEVSSISDKIDKGSFGVVTEADERPLSPVPSKQLELIVRKNVVAAAQSHEGKHSKRSSKSVSRTTMEEASGYSSRSIHLCRGLSPVRGDSPDVLDISSKPHEIKSLLPPAAAVRPMTPTQRVVFPPNIPNVLTRSRSPSPCRRKKTDAKVKGTPPFFIGLPVVVPNPEPVLECKVEPLETLETLECPTLLVTQASVEQTPTEDVQQSIVEQDETQHNVETELQEELSELTHTEKTEETVQTQVDKVNLRADSPLEDKYYSKTEVEKIVKEELQKVFLNLKEPPKEEKPPELSLDDLPAPIIASGDMALALSTASDRPFTPMPFPKAPALSLRPDDPEEPVKRCPQSQKYVPCPVPSEPYFPPPPSPPEKENRDERAARALREVGCRSMMTEALTVAPNRAYSPLPSVTKVEVSQSSIKDIKMLDTQKTTTVSSCPIKQVKPPLMIEKSAFTATGNGNGNLVPKSTPLVYIPHLQRQTELKSGERYGIPRDEIAQQGITKQVIAGFESTTTETHTINEDELRSLKSKDVQYSCAVARNPPPKPEGAAVQTIPTSGLRSDHLLPYYQQFIGDIPVRNRAISPAPHTIKAPSMTPVPMPTAPNLLSHPRIPVHYAATPPVTQHQKECNAAKQVCFSDCTMNAQQCKKSAADAKMSMVASSCQESTSKQLSSTQESSSKTVCQTSASSSKSCQMSTRTSRMVSPLAGKSSTLTLTGKQTFKPDIPARSLSPSWKANYVRSVQNLSPITVRLPSPQPTPLKPKGESTQTTTANIHVKNTKPKTSTSRSKPPTSTTHSSKPGVGPCGTSKGCGTPPSSPTPTLGPCGTSKGCGTPPGSPSCVSPDISQIPDNHKLGPCGTSKGCGTPPMSPTGRRSPARPISNGLSSDQICQTYSNRFEGVSNKENHLICKESKMSKSAASYSKTSLAINYEKNARSGQFQTSSSKTGSSSEVDTSLPQSIMNSPFHRSPLHPIPNSPNISWPSFPANLSLPRNCGVNPSSSGPNAGGAGGGLGGGRSSVAGSSAPRRGRGVLNAAVPIGGRVPLCGHCNSHIRGPFITALGKIWCPDHFVCVNPKCKRPLQDIGFVEEDDGLYCEFCFEQYLAPPCDKCRSKIKGDCLNAIGKHFHPECFKCSYCEKLFGNNPFFLEDGLPYCENDWNELFTTKCFSCGFPIEAGDRWVEALNNNYHSQCFNCTMCKKNLDGQSFFAKGGRPFCKNHAR